MGKKTNIHINNKYRIIQVPSQWETTQMFIGAKRNINTKTINPIILFLAEVKQEQFLG